ncbi:hemolymph lipopolysaccharide-binding protein [Anabrus simplex]|uniref:hemolymph lipopolysaccharide-binding protein n=1 Tax=Anabrus simplex TaxID=316456 RepID=UPI0035A30A6A
METFLPLFFVLALATVHVQTNMKCKLNDSANFHFSVSSRRNATGHRLVAVSIGHSVEYGSSSNNQEQVTVDVEHGTVWCDGTEELKTIAEASAAPVRFRHPDYELFLGIGYYKMHPKAETWDQARVNCNKEGAHLLIVNSEEEFGVVKQLFARKPKIEGATWNDWIYVGFSDRAVEGQYVTVLGEPLSSTGYVKWHGGQPDNAAWNTEPDQDCGGMHTGGTMQDLPCLGKTAYICEQEI